MRRLQNSTLLLTSRIIQYSRLQLMKMVTRQVKSLQKSLKKRYLKMNKIQMFKKSLNKTHYSNKTVTNLVKRVKPDESKIKSRPQNHLIRTKRIMRKLPTWNRSVKRYSCFRLSITTVWQLENKTNNKNEKCWFMDIIMVRVHWVTA